MATAYRIEKEPQLPSQKQAPRGRRRPDPLVRHELHISSPVPAQCGHEHRQPIAASPDRRPIRLNLYARRGTVERDLLRLWGPVVFVGALIGGGLAKFVSGDSLRAIFGVVGLLVAVNMALPKTLVVSDALPASKWINRLIAGIIGIISALMGIGGGTLSVPTLSAFSFPAHRAVGTASALGLLIAVPGVAGFIYAGLDVEGLPPGSLGYVSLPAVLIIAPISFLFAPLGTRFAHALDARNLKRVFALFLAITAVRMLMS